MPAKAGVAGGPKSEGSFDSNEDEYIIEQVLEIENFNISSYCRSESGC